MNLGTKVFAHDMVFAHDHFYVMYIPRENLTSRNRNSCEFTSLQGHEIGSGNP